MKDTIDAYITGICENEDSIYVTTLNKGLYGRPLNRPQESFWQIRDLSEYESVYGVIMNGRNKYLNTSLGIVNEENATLLPVKHVKSISYAYICFSINSTTPHGTASTSMECSPTTLSCPELR